MCKVPIHAVLAVLTAAAALACGPAGAQQLPSLFTRPQSTDTMQQYQYVEPQANDAEPQPAPSDDNENAQLAPRLQRQIAPR